MMLVQVYSAYLDDNSVMRPVKSVSLIHFSGQLSCQSMDHVDHWNRHSRGIVSFSSTSTIERFELIRQKSQKGDPRNSQQAALRSHLTNVKDTSPISLSYGMKKWNDSLTSPDKKFTIYLTPLSFLCPVSPSYDKTGYTDDLNDGRNG